MKTEEGKLKDQVKKLLDREQCYYNMPVPTGYGEPMLDFVGCYRGRFFAIETKAPGKKPTPRQQHTMKRMMDSGAWVICDDTIETLRLKLLGFFQAVDAGAVP